MSQYYKSGKHLFDKKLKKIHLFKTKLIDRTHLNLIVKVKLFKVLIRANTRPQPVIHGKILANEPPQLRSLRHSLSRKLPRSTLLSGA